MSTATQEPTESPAKRAKLRSETEVSNDKRNNEENSVDENKLYNDGLHDMTVEEWEIYAEAFNRSDGFDVPLLLDVTELGLVQPASDNWPAEDIREQADFAIKYHNEKMKKEGGSELQLKDVIKCNVQAACPLNYFITFRGQDVNTGEIDEYEAMTITFCGREDQYPIFRKKTKPTDPPAPTEVEV